MTQERSTPGGIKYLMGRTAPLRGWFRSREPDDNGASNLGSDRLEPRGTYGLRSNVAMYGWPVIGIC